MNMILKDNKIVCFSCSKYIQISFPHEAFVQLCSTARKSKVLYFCKDCWDANECGIEFPDDYIKGYECEHLNSRNIIFMLDFILQEQVKNKNIDNKSFTYKHDMCEKCYNNIIGLKL